MRVGIISCAIKVTIAFGLILTYLWFYKFSILTYFVTFFWGIQDSNMGNLLNCALGFEFESKSLPFSVYNFI